jgi:carbonic anhydrase
MSRVLKEVLAANAAYAKSFGDKAKLRIPPARRFAVLTCMDARIDPAKLAGLAEGDAHVIRNAGGRASDDAIRSLIISHKLLGTLEWFVVHHTDCGMGMFTDDTMRILLANSLETATLGPGGWRNTGKGPGSSEGDFIDWLTFKDPAEAVLTDIRRIRAHPLVPGGIPIYGYIYDVKSGRLEEVRGAKALGGVARGSGSAAMKASRRSARKAVAAKKAAPAAAKKAGAPKPPAAAGRKAGAGTKKARAAAKPAAASAGRSGSKRSRNKAA